MKTFLLLGGFAGFLISFLSSLHVGNPLTFAVRDGTIGCLVGALLFRGLHLVYFHVARQRFAIRAEEIKALAHAKRSENRS